jgi:hypothetical protein
MLGAIAGSPCLACGGGESVPIDKFASLRGKVAIVDLAQVGLLRTFGCSIIGVRESENRITSHSLAVGGSHGRTLGRDGATSGDVAAIIGTLATQVAQSGVAGERATSNTVGGQAISALLASSA